MISTKKCLIVVDYQNDFVTGSLGFPESVAIEQNIAKKIMKYRENGDEIIFTLDTHDEDYLETQEGQNLPVIHCVKNTQGHKLYGIVETLAKNSDKKFEKYVFGSDKLYEYLKIKEFETIELVGVVSNICVISNAVLAKTAQPKTPIIVDAKCTAGIDPYIHKAALDVMESLQIKIINR